LPTAKKSEGTAACLVGRFTTQRQAYQQTQTAQKIYPRFLTFLAISVGFTCKTAIHKIPLIAQTQTLPTMRFQNFG
jgi:hypothetical protein